jgi:hypothetical protein
VEQRPSPAIKERVEGRAISRAKSEHQLSVWIRVPQPSLPKRVKPTSTTKVARVWPRRLSGLVSIASEVICRYGVKKRTTGRRGSREPAH